MIFFLSNKSVFFRDSRVSGFFLGSGFTLIEVVIAVFLLGTVISISVPSLFGMRDQQLRLKCLSNLRQLQSAKDAYVLDHLGEGSPTDPDHQAVFRSYFVEGFVYPEEESFSEKFRCPITGQDYEGLYDVYKKTHCFVCEGSEMGLPPEISN